MIFEYSQPTPLVPGGETDPYFLFISRLSGSIETARRLIQDPSRVYSYRGFYVAGMLAGVTAEAGLYTEFWAGNTKSKRSKEKRCAELKLLRKHTRHGLLQAVGLIVVGPEGIDEINSVMPTKRRTLLPCLECTVLIGAHKGVVDDMPIITTGYKNDYYEVHDQAEVHRYHRNPADSDATPSSARLSSGEAERRAELYLPLWVEERKFSPGGQRTDAQIARVALSTPLV